VNAKRNNPPRVTKEFQHIIKNGNAFGDNQVLLIGWLLVITHGELLKNMLSRGILANSPQSC